MFLIYIKTKAESQTQRKQNIQSMPNENFVEPSWYIQQSESLYFVILVC